MASPELRSKRREQVIQCLASDLTVNEWCGLNRIHPSTWYKWAAKFRREEPEIFEGSPSRSEWIEVSRESIRAARAIVPAGDEARPAGPDAGRQGQQASRGCIIARVNGVELAIPPGADEALLAMAFRAARS